MNNQTPEGDHWVDHLQNAIDLLVPTLTTAQSRALAEGWDAIFMAAEAEQNNCDDCQAAIDDHFNNLNEGILG